MSSSRARTDAPKVVSGPFFWVSERLVNDEPTLGENRALEFFYVGEFLTSQIGDLAGRETTTDVGLDVFGARAVLDPGAR